MTTRTTAKNWIDGLPPWDGVKRINSWIGDPRFKGGDSFGDVHRHNSFPGVSIIGTRRHKIH